MLVRVTWIAKTAAETFYFHIQIRFGPIGFGS